MHVYSCVGFGVCTDAKIVLPCLYALIGINIIQSYVVLYSLALQLYEVLLAMDSLSSEQGLFIMFFAVVTLYLVFLKLWFFLQTTKIYYIWLCLQDGIHTDVSVSFLDNSSGFF